MAAVLPSAYPAETRALMEVGRFFHGRGWSDCTSSNYSLCLSRDPLRILITASGRDKGRLTEGDFVIVNELGLPVSEPAEKPSAETLLHVVAYEQQPQVGAVLHTHSPWSTILSDLPYPQNNLTIEGYEMQKGLAGVTSHQARVSVKIFENTQKIDELARRLRLIFPEQQASMKYGFLLKRHGLYTWGKDLEEARRHVETLEFLFDVLARRQMLGLTN